MTPGDWMELVAILVLVALLIRTEISFARMKARHLDLIAEVNRFASRFSRVEHQLNEAFRRTQESSDRILEVVTSGGACRRGEEIFLLCQRLQEAIEGLEAVSESHRQPRKRKSE